MQLILRAGLKFSRGSLVIEWVKGLRSAVSWELNTLAADVIAGSRGISSFECGGKELERGDEEGKLDGYGEGVALSVTLMSACCGDVWAMSYRTKFQKAFSCLRLSVN